LPEILVSNETGEVVRRSRLGQEESSYALKASGSDLDPPRE